MSRVRLVGCVLLLSLSSASYGVKPADPLAEWNFDEGRGAVARDQVSGKDSGALHGPAWIKRGDGFALELDGLDDHFKADHPEISGPVALEFWIKPTGLSYGEPHLVGRSMSSFTFTYYPHHEKVNWYVGQGGNHVRGHVKLAQWNHVVGTWDGEHIGLWINGKRVDYRKTKEKTYEPATFIAVGTDGRPELPDYKGAIDDIRLYAHVPPDDEIRARFWQRAVEYGYDARWLERVKVTGYEYFQRRQVVVEADYRLLPPLAEDARIEVELVDQKQPDKVLQRHTINSLPEAGIAEAILDCADLQAGQYVARVRLVDGAEAIPVEKVDFPYPPTAADIMAPRVKTVGSLPPDPGPTPYRFRLDDGGGFTLTIKDRDYPFVTRVSWPNGKFNHLSAGDPPAAESEAAWTVDARAGVGNRHTVEARGTHYSVRRQIDVLPTHVYVRDTYTNATREDLGLLIYNEIPVDREQLVTMRLGGWERGGRYIEAFSPSVFIADDHAGIGIVPIDDVYVVQSVLYAEPDASGTGTEKFALAPGASYTLEWAVYPTGSGHYYDFINAFRQVEDRISTIDGAPGFITWGPMNHRQIPDKQFIAYQGTRYGIIHCLSGTADDPELSIEGIEFMDFPKEMALVKRQTRAIHQRYPGFKAMFHVAHSLYCTNEPDRFADSKVIRADGTQAMWGWSEGYISLQRKEEGWRWWIYYPTPGNSFHDALMRSADVMMDDMGMGGAFMDGFFAGYQGLWTYDGTWDGHSADIDPSTKTIQRKVGSVLLLSQPSLIEFTRRIRDKGGVIVANGSVITRSIANEKYIIHDWESSGGPQLHLAPNLTALTSGRTEREVYHNALENLTWGELAVPYSIRVPLTRPLMAAKQYPMTFERIDSGLVQGKNRIVTMNSGVYGWPDNPELHLVLKYDARGGLAGHDFLTTVDSSGVRTQVNFAEHESAVIEPIPVILDSASPVNVRVLDYGDTSLHLLASGEGQVELSMFVGAVYQRKKGAKSHRLPGIGADYAVTVNGETAVAVERDGLLTVPLELDGRTEVEIRPAE